MQPQHYTNNTFRQCGGYNQIGVLLEVGGKSPEREALPSWPVAKKFCVGSARKMQVDCEVGELEGGFQAFIFPVSRNSPRIGTEGSGEPSGEDNRKEHNAAPAVHVRATQDQVVGKGSTAPDLRCPISPKIHPSPFKPDIAQNFLSYSQFLALKPCKNTPFNKSHEVFFSSHSNGIKT